MNKYLNILSLILSFSGSLAFAKGLFISKKEAVNLGVSRWSADTEEENLKLPQVKDRINQRKWGFIGAILCFLGFIIQIALQINGLS